jgi:Ricin-type beta-trefoil lectin domain-like
MKGQNAMALPPLKTFGTFLVKHSGKALDVANGSTDNGAPIIQFHITGGPNQQFRVEPIGGSDKLFRIVNKRSGKALQVKEEEIGPDPLFQFERADQQGQLFFFREEGDFFFVLSVLGGALDVRSASSEDGAQVISFPVKNADRDNQLWRFVPGPEDPCQPIIDRIHECRERIRIGKEDLQDPAVPASVKKAIERDLDLQQRRLAVLQEELKKCERA